MPALIMWDEDPRWQEAHYKFALRSAVVLGLLSLVLSVITGDWSVARWYFSGFGIFLAALCLYAAVVWTAAHGVSFLIRVFKIGGRKHPHRDV